MNIQSAVEHLPTHPGVYLFKDTKGEVLYVGKAKVLRSRVKSYFSRVSLTPGVEEKTPGVSPARDLEPAKQKMVEQIADIETITTNNETEALVLEANLIREHQPPYNVILRDDKFYLFIKITTNEDLPRVFPTRKLKNDGARYFGPFSSAASVRKTLRLLQRIFPYRGEQDSPRDHVFPHPLFSTGKPPQSPLSGGSTDPSPDKGRSGGVSSPYKLEAESYKLSIKNITHFLSGKRDDITKTLEKGMKDASKNKQYERAATFRDQLQAVERLEGPQNVYLPRKESFDVISIARDKSSSAANVFKVRNGKLLDKQTFLLKHRAAALLKDTIRQFILQYYSIVRQVGGDEPDIPRTIFVPMKLVDDTVLSEWIDQNNPPSMRVPKRGKKRKLLEMGKTNAQQLLNEQEAVFESAQRLKQAHDELVKAINLDARTTHRIETYDISNIQGKFATASMVVFIDGQAQKNQYKKFRIKTNGSPDDYSMIRETLQRRFGTKHAGSPPLNAKVDQRWPLPDLIIIDGGKGQLSTANKALEEMGVKIPVISIAKKEEEIFIPGRMKSIRLPFDSDALYLIQRMRDEAHRFTTSYHQLLRSKKQKQSILDEVPGVGPKTKKKLLNRFGSLRMIRAANAKELEQVIGKSKTALLQDYL